MNYITPELLISIISGLVVCAATMFWFFFRRLYKLIDGSAPEAVNITTNKVYL